MTDKIARRLQEETGASYLAAKQKREDKKHDILAAGRGSSA